MRPAISAPGRHAAMTPDVARPDAVSALPHGLLEAKLLVPHQRPGMVRRTRVLRRLRAAGECRVISFVAPPGYGKTSALVQWASHDPRRVAWLTADDGDNDPVVLLTYLAAAIDRLAPLDPGIFDAIASPAVPDRAVVGRLLAAVSGRAEPILLAIDDAHRITGQACLDALAELITYLPAGSQVALAGRSPWPCLLRAGAPTRPCSRSGPTTSRWTSRKCPRWPPDLGSRCRPSRRRS